MTSPTKVVRIMFSLPKQFKHRPDTNTRVKLCLHVYHTPWLTTKDRYVYTSLDWSSRSERKVRLQESLDDFIENRTSYLFGRSGPQTLDSCRLETSIRLRANQVLSLTVSCFILPSHGVILRSTLFETGRSTTSLFNKSSSWMFPPFHQCFLRGKKKKKN
jgi:hypothetical protein